MASVWARTDMVEVGAFGLPKAATRIGDPKGIGQPMHKFHAEFERLAPKSSTRSTTSSGTTSSPKPRSDVPYHFMLIEVTAAFRLEGVL